MATTLTDLRWWLVGLALTGLLMGLTLGSAGLASAQVLPNVLCGQVLATANTTVTLSGPVGPCDGDGITIAADNVTLDLNGHDVFGLQGAPQLTGEGVGILFDNVNGSTVRDSTAGGSEVRWFDAGVVIQGGGANTVEDVKGINENQGETSTFGVGLGGDGVGIWSSDGNTISGNDLHDNGPWSGIGVYSSHNNTVEDNTLTDHDYQVEPVFANQNIGIRVGAFSNTNTFDGNSVSGSALDGITVFTGSSDNTFTGNTLHSNTRDGIRLFFGAHDNDVITGNVAHSNGNDGIYVVSDRNEVSGNEAHSNTGHGIHLAWSDVGVGGEAEDNTVDDNLTCANGTDGISAAENATGNTLDANRSGTGAGCATNGGFDLADYNFASPCVNTWGTNTFITSNNPCI